MNFCGNLFLFIHFVNFYLFCLVKIYKIQDAIDSYNSTQLMDKAKLL